VQTYFLAPLAPIFPKNMLKNKKKNENFQSKTEIIKNRINVNKTFE
jgi:hypothetical protein